MSFVDRSKEVAATVGAAARKQARRAQLEVEAKRVSQRIERQYTAIGRALYPRLVEGAPGADLPEVEQALGELKTLKQEHAEKRRDIEALLASDTEEGEVIDSTASETSRPGTDTSV